MSFQEIAVLTDDHYKTVVLTDGKTFKVKEDCLGFSTRETEASTLSEAMLIVAQAWAAEYDNGGKDSAYNMIKNNVKAI